MEIKNLQTWEEFESEVSLLIKYRDSLQTELRNPDTLVFRGQRDANWYLETTLEREANKDIYPIEKYFQVIKKAKNQIKNISRLSSTNWDVLDAPHNADWYSLRNALYPQGLLNYMVFLRHHGFPSPLLDWTHSIDIASYFAFHDANSGNERVAIFAFLDHTNSSKSLGWASDPKILKARPDKNIEANLDKRHIKQQGTYTYCEVEIKRNLYYSKHEKVFSGNIKHRFSQDVLWKFTLPISEKNKVIKNLESKLINTSFLFESHDPQQENQYYKDLFNELEKTAQ